MFPTPTGRPSDGHPRVTVRYWASVRAEAGLREETVTGATVAEALAAVRRLHEDSARFGSLVDICAIVVDGSPVGLRKHEDVPLGDGSVVELLPPFAGGGV